MSDIEKNLIEGMQEVRDCLVHGKKLKGAKIYIPDPINTKRIRKKLGLNQKEAGELIGGGPNAFCRYETGRSYPTRGTENFLRVLDNHPELIIELKNEAA